MPERWPGHGWGTDRPSSTDSLTLRCLGASLSQQSSLRGPGDTFPKVYLFFQAQGTVPVSQLLARGEQ